MRPSHGLTFMANYTWSHIIDDGGTFRSGYPIPAAYSNTGTSWAADRIERSASTSNQPQHVVVTGVWDMPFGRSVLAGSAWERAILGGYKFSEIFQAFSGSPLAITGSSCQTNPAESTCNPMLNPTSRRFRTGQRQVGSRHHSGEHQRDQIHRDQRRQLHVHSPNRPVHQLRCHLPQLVVCAFLYVRQCSSYRSVRLFTVRATMTWILPSYAASRSTSRKPLGWI